MPSPSTMPRRRFLHSLSCEHNRDRAPVLDHLPGRRQLAGTPITPERDHGVALFVCRVEEMTARIEADEARGAALGRLPADHAQQSFRADGKDGDAVVAAIGAVSETAVERNSDFGRGAVA